MANKRQAAYNGHFGVVATIRIIAATWRDVPCAPVTVPTGGISGNQERKVRLYFRGAAFASPEISRSRAVDPPQSEARGTLPICLRDLSVARPTMFAVSTPASAIRPDRGTRSAVSWPKWSGTPASWFLASVIALICRALPIGWWRSIITVARRSLARTPSTGPVCHVASSATMPFGSSFTPWPTIWARS